MRGLGRSLRIACSLCLLSSAACKLPGTTAVDTAAAYSPTWISASWGASAGPPTLRFNRDAVLHFDPICPAYSIGLRISAGYDSLTVASNCEGAATFYLCTTSGFPSGALHACADNPFNTPSASFAVQSVAGGASWDAGSPAQNFSVELFYCGAQSTMLFGPLRCAP